MNFSFGDQNENLRKSVTKRLSSGQTITLTLQVEKMLRAAYEYAQGYSKRQMLENYIYQKRQELSEVAATVPLNIRQTLLMPSSTRTTVMTTNTPSLAGFRKEMPVDHGTHSKEVSEINRLNSELATLVENAQTLAKTDSKITINDLEALLKQLGVNPQRRVLEHMIYEVDEQADDVICWEEFQLCYFRNVNDTTGNEPSSFFRIIEFLTFDPSHKGSIMEDDVMEVLFIRLGAARLEQELKLIFGNSLRALGGPGTLTLDAYMGACLRKTGRRALVT